MWFLLISFLLLCALPNTAEHATEKDLTQSPLLEKTRDDHQTKTLSLKRLGALATRSKKRGRSSSGSSFLAGALVACVCVGGLLWYGVRQRRRAERPFGGAALIPAGGYHAYGAATGSGVPVAVLIDSDEEVDRRVISQSLEDGTSFFPVLPPAAVQRLQAQGLTVIASNERIMQIGDTSTELQQALAEELSSHLSPDGGAIARAAQRSLDLRRDLGALPEGGVSLHMACPETARGVVRFLVSGYGINKWGSFLCRSLHNRRRLFPTGRGPEDGPWAQRFPHANSVFAEELVRSCAHGITAYQSNNSPLTEPVKFNREPLSMEPAVRAVIDGLEEGDRQLETLLTHLKGDAALQKKIIRLIIEVSLDLLQERFSISLSRAQEMIIGAVWHDVAARELLISVRSALMGPALPSTNDDAGGPHRFRSNQRGEDV